MAERLLNRTSGNRDSGKSENRNALGLGHPSVTQGWNEISGLFAMKIEKGRVGRQTAGSARDRHDRKQPNDR